MEGARRCVHCRQHRELPQERHRPGRRICSARRPCHGAPATIRTMPLTMLAPALLSAVVPELARQRVRLPNLEALLAAGRIRDADDSAEHWLCAQLGMRASAEPPIAALRLASETATNVENGNGYWLCADPIATTMGVDSVRIDRAVSDLTQAQSAALTESLSEFFAQDGLRFVAGSVSSWYVQCDVPQRLVTTPLWRAIGGSMLLQFPTGPDASAWNARLNEAQMLLHAHPVNAAREESGLARVASVWWWGGGSWPAFGPAAFDAVAGGPPWVGAACEASSVDFQPVSAGPTPIFHTSARRTLLIIDDEWEQSAMTPDPLSRWDGAWFGPLRTALDAGELDQATLVFPWGDGTLHVDFEHTRRPRWRRWFGSARPAAPPTMAETLKAFER
jgi:hypothetical protein